MKTTISDFEEILRPFAYPLREKKVFVTGYDGSVPDAGSSKYDLVLINSIGEPPALQLDYAKTLLVTGGAIIVVLDNVAERSGFRELIRRTDYGYCRLYYAFPDFASPEVVLREEAFELAEFNAGNLVEPVFNSRGETRGVIRRFLAAGRFKELADHMIAIVSDNSDWYGTADTLAYTFTRGRSEAFKKVTVFFQGEDGCLRVRRQRYQETDVAMGGGGNSSGDEVAGNGDLIGEGSAVRQELREERYLPGRLYSLELTDIVSRAGWSVEDVIHWSQPYLALLREYAINTVTDVSGDLLDGKFLDLVPFNLLTHNNMLTAIDQEWIARDPLPLQYIFFRGLYHSFARIGSVAVPIAGTPLNLYGLCLAIAGASFPDVAAVLDSFVELEPRYFKGVFDGKGLPPGDVDLMIMGRDGEKPRTPVAGDLLYPLMNVNLQVFVAGADEPFREERSATARIGLTEERRVFSIPLPQFSDDVTRLRIDPSDHSGLVQLHAIHLRSEGEELFYWTPYSRSPVELDGVVFLNTAPLLPCPVMVLVNYDPQIVFSLFPVIRKSAAAKVVLEVELSALTPALYAATRTTIIMICDMLLKK